MAKEVLVPPLGQTTAEVTLVHWYKQEGDAVQAGEPLYSIETDKAVLDVEAPASGVLRSVSAAEGDTVPVLKAIAVIAAEGEAFAAGRAPAALARLPETPQPAAQPTVSPVATQEAMPAVADRPAGESVPAAAATPRRAIVTNQHRRALISPRARRLAEAEGLDWSQLAGTGPEGAIVERDVEAALAAKRAAQTPAAPTRVAASSAPISPLLAMAQVDWTQMQRVQVQWERARRGPGVHGLLGRILARALEAHPGVQVSLTVRDSGASVAFAPPIVPPHVAAVGVGRVSQRPWVVDGQVSVRPVAWVTLAADPSALDASAAEAVIADLVRLMEQPALLLA